MVWDNRVVSTYLKKMISYIKQKGRYAHTNKWFKKYRTTAGNSSSYVLPSSIHCPVFNGTRIRTTLCAHLP